MYVQQTLHAAGRTRRYYACSLCAARMTTEQRVDQEIITRLVSKDGEELPQPRL